MTLQELAMTIRELEKKISMLEDNIQHIQDRITLIETRVTDQGRSQHKVVMDKGFLPRKANWIAMDEDGSWFWYESKPTLVSGIRWSSSDVIWAYIPKMCAPKGYKGDCASSLTHVNDL